MTTWTMDQVRKARGIRARVEIDETYWETPPAADLVRLFHKHMQPIADTFAIVLDPRDIRFERTASTPEREQVTVTAWWEPETHTIEIQGGHEDGRTYEFVGAPHEPIRLVPLTSAPGPFDTTIWQEDLPQPLIAECIGWHEQERHWVYGVRR